MKYNLEFIPTFYTDILTVEEFLKEYPGKTARIFARIDKTLKQLEEMPEMHAVYQDVPSFRYIVIEDYLVFYKINERNSTVEVHRLIYGRMDITAKLD